MQLTRSSLRKEDVTSGKGKNVISSLGKKELKSEELKKENQTAKVQRIGVTLCSAEGLKRKPIVWCEDEGGKVVADPASVFLSRRAADLLATLIQPVQAGPEEDQLVQCEY